MKVSLMLYVITSVLLKNWLERERNKMMPEIMYRAITEGGFPAGLRVNIKARQTAD